ncbi:hypothetical protein SFRURICE_007229 [Spodoptera frugiperda]|nr:hypothetical protein SFRURICE_007229 [Spodoptera frugiperda]
MSGVIQGLPRSLSRNSVIAPDMSVRIDSTHTAARRGIRTILVLGRLPNSLPAPGYLHAIKQRGLQINC